jgi:hypothetical protein
MVSRSNFDSTPPPGPSLVLACDSEQDAVDRATELAGETVVELWDGAHMVCRIPSSKK